MDIVLEYAGTFSDTHPTPILVRRLGEAGVQIPQQAVSRAQVWNQCGNCRTVDLVCYSQQLLRWNRRLVRFSSGSNAVFKRNTPDSIDMASTHPFSFDAERLETETEDR